MLSTLEQTGHSNLARPPAMGDAPIPSPNSRYISATNNTTRQYGTLPPLPSLTLLLAASKLTHTHLPQEDYDMFVIYRVLQEDGRVGRMLVAQVARGSVPGREAALPLLPLW